MTTKRAGGILRFRQGNAQRASAARNFQCTPVIDGQRSRGIGTSFGNGERVRKGGHTVITRRIVGIRSTVDELTGRHGFLHRCAQRDFGLAECDRSSVLVCLCIDARLRFTVAVQMVRLVALPAVVGGLVVVVHICIHVFVFPVKVGCSRSRIGCGVRVHHFGLILRRRAES